MKHVVVFVFGEQAAEAYECEGFKAMCKVLEGDGALVRREFDTLEEVRAYQQGVEDMDGWLRCCIIDDDDVKAHPRLIKKYT